MGESRAGAGGEGDRAQAEEARAFTAAIRRRRDLLSQLFTVVQVVRAKIRFRRGLQRHQAKRVRLYVALFSLVLLVGICLVALAMRRAGLNAILTQLSHISTVGITAMGVQVEGYLSEQSAAALAVSATIRRGDIALGAGNPAADGYLLTVLDAFELSSVSIVVPSMGTFTAGKHSGAGDAWISYSDVQTGCTNSWSVQGSRSMATESTSATCSYEEVPEAISALGDGLTWLASSYSRTESTCTSHTCGEAAHGETVIGAASGLLDGSGSSLATVVAERSVQSLNEKLEAIQTATFDGSRGSVRPHIWMMDPTDGTILASTNPDIATDLVAGVGVHLATHAAMQAARDALFVQDGTYAAAAALRHLPETPQVTLWFLDWFFFWGFFRELETPMIRCSELSQPIADRPIGWMLCLQVEPDYWISLTLPTACSTVGVAVVHLSLLVGTSSMMADRRINVQRNIQLLCIMSALVVTFALWAAYTRHDIMILIDDLVDHTIDTVARKTSLILSVPQTALTLLQAHRNLGSLVHGNTSVAEVQRGDSIFLDMLGLYPDLYMAYTGISYAVGNHETCTSNCRCDHANDRSDCCLAWTLSGNASYHCAGLADDRHAFFHGAKRKSSGEQLEDFQVVGRDLWALDEDGTMLRRGYVPSVWQHGVSSGRSRDFGAVNDERFYNPVARPWFSSALEEPDRGWSSVYLFSTTDPTTGRRPLGITAVSTSVESQQEDDMSVPTGALPERRITVDAVDFTLQGIDTFLSTIEFSPPSENGTEPTRASKVWSRSQGAKAADISKQVDGVVFIMEMDGTLIGTSDQGASTITYYEGASEQRVSCPSDVNDARSCTTSGRGEHLVSPIIRLAHRELLVRFGSLEQWKDSGTEETLFVGHGHEEGPLAVRTALLESGEEGVQWLLCVALKSDDLLRPFSDAYSMALMTALSCLMILLILSHALSLVDANDLVDGRWKEVWRKMNIPSNLRGTGEGDNPLELHELGNNQTPSPSQDLDEFCETRRKQLLVDIEVAGLLEKCKSQSASQTLKSHKLGDDWDPAVWLDHLFFKTGAFFGGPAYLRSVVKTPKDDRKDIDAWKVAEMLLHVGFVERGCQHAGTPSSDDLTTQLDDDTDASLNLGLMRKLKLFLRNTRDEKWAWDAITKSREIAETTVSTIVNRTGLCTSKLEGLPVETQNFIYHNFKVLSDPKFWQHTAECVKAGQPSSEDNAKSQSARDICLLSQSNGLLDLIDTKKFKLLSIGLNCSRCKAKRTRAENQAPYSTAQYCGACRAKRDVLDEYLLFVMAAKQFLTTTCVVRKFMQNCPDDSDPWRDSSDDPIIRELISIVLNHCQERCAPLWRDWVCGKPIVWANSMEPGSLCSRNMKSDAEDDALDELTECLQGMGFSGTKSTLQPLFNTIRHQAHTIRARRKKSFRDLRELIHAPSSTAVNEKTREATHKILADVSPFNCLSDEALKKIAKHFEPRTVGPRATIIAKYAMSNEMYVIVPGQSDGKVFVGLDEGDDDNLLNELIAGSVFGESSALNNTARSCFVWNASSTENLQLLMIEGQALQEMLEEFPSFGKRLRAMGHKRQTDTLWRSIDVDCNDWNRCMKLLSCGSFKTCTIGDVCRWERQDQHHRYQMSRLRHSAYYRQFIIHFVSAVHMALAFVESPSGSVPLTTSDDERLQKHSTIGLIVGGCAIATYWLDIALYCVIHDGLNRYKGAPMAQPSIPADVPQLTLQQRNARLSAGREDIRRQRSLTALVAVIALLTMDWALQLFLGYSTEPTPRDSLEQHLVLLLPYSAILRPVVLVLRSDSLRDGASSFIRTMLHSGTIFLLFLIILAAFGVIGMVLFATDHGELYGDVFVAMSHMFTYMTTAENWPDLVWPATGCDRPSGYTSGHCFTFFFHVYFWTASFVGTIILVSLMIATFESKYTEEHKVQEEKRRMRQLDGIVATYLVLDQAGNNRLSVKQVGDFLAACSLNYVKLGRRGQGLTLKLSVSEFATLCEQLQHEFEGCQPTSMTMTAEEDVVVVTQEIRDRSDHNLMEHQAVGSFDREDEEEEDEDADVSSLPSRYVSSGLHSVLMTAVSLVHLGSTGCMNTGLLFFGVDVDLTSSICVCIFHIDVIARVFAAGGWTSFHHVPYSIFAQSKNRYDAWISGLSIAFLGLGAAQLIFEVKQSEPDGSTSSFFGLDSWNRIALALPVLRLFSGPKSIRTIWFCLSSILPNYSSVVVLGAIGLYCFGCGGCWLLAFRFHHLGPEVYDLPEANFNSMLDSVTTLFQLFIGEAWNSVKQAAVDSNGGFIELFFLVYILTMTVLFVNLLSGVILSSWEVVATVIETERRNANISVRQFQQLAAHQDISTDRLEVQFKAGSRNVRIVPSTKSVFGSADADNSGTISLQELTEQIGEKAAQELWRRVDLDGDRR